MTEMTDSITSTAVPALDKAVAILDYLSEHGFATFTELSALPNLPKSTLSRQLASLIEHGLVRMQGDKYALGLRLYQYGQSAYTHYDLKDAARPALAKLRDATGLTCHLGILEGMQTVYLDKLESPYTVIVRSYVGKRLPVHSTALGKVLLAFSATDLRDSIIKARLPFERFTEHTLTSIKDLYAELDQVRLQGFACDEEEDNEGVVCYAVPVFAAPSQIAAAISVTGVKAQYKDLPFLELLDKLQACARQISATLQ